MDEVVNTSIVCVTSPHQSPSVTASPQGEAFLYPFVLILSSRRGKGAGAYRACPRQRPNDASSLRLIPAKKKLRPLPAGVFLMRLTTLKNKARWSAPAFLRLPPHSRYFSPPCPEDRIRLFYFKASAISLQPSRNPSIKLCFATA